MYRRGHMRSRSFNDVEERAGGRAIGVGLRVQISWMSAAYIHTYRKGPKAQMNTPRPMIGWGGISLFFFFFSPLFLLFGFTSEMKAG